LLAGIQSGNGQSCGGNKDVIIFREKVSEKMLIFASQKSNKMMDTNEVISKLQRIKPYLQREYAVKTVGLFGSFAAGDYTDNSDVDIMVDFERPVGVEFIDLSYLLEKELNRKVDLVSVKGIKDKYLKEIEKDIVYV
jgi:predicted nucleotidyltransferase